MRFGAGFLHVISAAVAGMVTALGGGRGGIAVKPERSLAGMPRMPRRSFGPSLAPSMPWEGNTRFDRERIAEAAARRERRERQREENNERSARMNPAWT
jgi:hypothetical protein